MLQFEMPGPKEMADTDCPFKAGDDALTLAGLDGGWETIGLQQNLAQERSDSSLDDNGPGYMDLDLNASPTGFPWHASASSDAPCFYNLSSSALDQFMLDLDSDNEETVEGETVLDF